MSQIMWTTACRPFQVTSEKIALYAELTDDFNPIHMDADFAANTEFGDVIAHGTMSVNLIWLALEGLFGRAAIEDARLEVKFIKPVRNHDILTAEMPSDTSGLAVVPVRVVNQQQDVVIGAEAEIVSR